MDDLLDAMTAASDLASCYFLDLESGKVLMLTEEIHDGTNDRAIEEAIEEHPDRYPEIPRVETREQYDWMCHFAELVQEDDLRDKLGLALAGQGAFGRFRQTVLGYPDLNAQWLAMRQKLLLEEAVSWLHGLQIEPIYQLRIIQSPTLEPRAPEPPRIGLLDLLLLGAPEGKTERIEGRVLRQISARSPSEARGLFKHLARELAAHYGLEWRNRFIEGKNNFEVERARLELRETRVELRIEVSNAVWKAFMN
jgi:hypothetical protein